MQQIKNLKKNGIKSKAKEEFRNVEEPTLEESS